VGALDCSRSTCSKIMITIRKLLTKATVLLGGVYLHCFLTVLHNALYFLLCLLSPQPPFLMWWRVLGTLWVCQRAQRIKQISLPRVTHGQTDKSGHVSHATTTTDNDQRHTVIHQRNNQHTSTHTYTNISTFIELHSFYQWNPQSKKKKRKHHRQTIAFLWNRPTLPYERVSLSSQQAGGLWWAPNNTASNTILSHSFSVCILSLFLGEYDVEYTNRSL
jgi:xanthosine utilization system XapX-like protein